MDALPHAISADYKGTYQIPTRQPDSVRPDVVVFDLDGTLTDPAVGITRSLNYALEQLGHQTRDPDELTSFIGPPLDEAFTTLTGCRSPREIAALVAKYRERYSEVGFAENQIYPGIPEVLEVFRTSGILLGLCTSKRKDFAVRILELFRLSNFFQFVDGGDVGIAKSEQIASLRRAGVVTGASVMIGDRAVDITAAHRSGLAAGGVLWGYGTRGELESASPKYLFDSVTDLVTLAG